MLYDAARGIEIKILRAILKLRYAKYRTSTKYWVRQYQDFDISSHLKKDECRDTRERLVWSDLTKPAD